MTPKNSTIWQPWMEEFDTIWQQQLGKFLKIQLLILNFCPSLVQLYFDINQKNLMAKQGSFLHDILKTHSINFFFKFLQLVYVFGTQSFFTF
jgi:hypothetical protein